MATKITKIQMRRDSKENWTSVNPILDAGEIGVELDSGKMKVGDGSTNFTNLNYFKSKEKFTTSHKEKESTGVIDGNVGFVGLIYASDGTDSPRVSTQPARNVSEYIEAQGDRTTIHNMFIPGGASYCALATYDEDKNMVATYNREYFGTTSASSGTEYQTYTFENTGFKYFRFQTISDASEIKYEFETDVTVEDIIDLSDLDEKRLTYKDSGLIQQSVESDPIVGLIGYPNGDDQPAVSSASRNRSDYVEVPQGTIVLPKLFVPAGATYAAYAFYNANKELVEAQNLTTLGKTGAVSYDDVEITVPTSAKYIRFQVEDTTTIPVVTFEEDVTPNYYKLPETITDSKGRVLISNGDGTTKWGTTSDTAFSMNKGKSIGIFGGSFSTLTYATRMYELWEKCLGVTTKTYGKGGAGFCHGDTFIKQANGAGVHDIYVIYCSTNDFTNQHPIGTVDQLDYSTNPSQWSGIKKMLEILYAKNPKAKICLMTSTPHLANNKGNEEGIGTGSLATHIRDYVKGQVDACTHFSIPCLDQYTASNHNSFTKGLVCRTGDFHLTDFGYEVLAGRQIDFLANL